VSLRVTGGSCAGVCAAGSAARDLCHCDNGDKFEAVLPRELVHPCYLIGGAACAHAVHPGRVDREHVAQVVGADDDELTGMFFPASARRIFGNGLGTGTSSLNWDDSGNSAAGQRPPRPSVALHVACRVGAQLLDSVGSGRPRVCQLWLGHYSAQYGGGCTRKMRWPRTAPDAMLSIHHFVCSVRP
jgi:hypothetical protein